MNNFFVKYFTLIFIFPLTLVLSYEIKGLFILSIISFFPQLYYKNKTTPFTYYTLTYVSINIWIYISGFWLYETIGKELILLASICGVIYLIPFFFLRRYGHTAFIISWIIVEIFHLTTQFGFPVLILGYHWNNNLWLVQWYYYFSAVGGSLMILIVNCIIYNFISKYINLISFVIILLFNSLIIFSPYILGKSESNISKNITFTIFSSDYPNTSINSIQRIRKGLKYINLEKSDSVDITLWPESTINGFSPRKESLTIGKIEKAVKENKTGLLSGISWREDNKNYNGIIFINDAKRILFFKKNYVPFFESYPYQLKGVSKKIGIASKLNIEKKLDKEPNILFYKGIKLGILLCYDSFFNYTLEKQKEKNIDGMIVLMNESWFNDRRAYNRMNSILSIKAIESNNYIIKSSNKGYSTIIAPNGKIEKKCRDCYIKQQLEIPISKNTSYISFNLKMLLSIFYLIIYITLTKYKKTRNTIRK